MSLPALSDHAYRIESELGSGGGSVVYKAWHSRLQKYVVLKRIKDESGLIQSGLQRGEVDILKNLKHTYLPQLYDFLDDPSGVYTVIEFIPGRSFADLLKEGRRFTQKDVIRWAEELSGALAYLHGQKPTVLHSDIKPANIMLTPEGDVCLIDFNISLVLDGDEAKALGLSHGYASPEQYGLPGMQSIRQASPVKPSNEQIAPAVTELDNRYVDSSATELSTGNTTDLRIENSGSPAYAQPPSPPSSQPPQPYTPQPQPPQPQPYTPQPPPPQPPQQWTRMDARSDIYSFGATLYHLLTGERPETATGSIKPIGAYSGVGLSEAFIYIIERCMERDPLMRFQSAADLHDAIANIHRLDNRWKRQRAKTAVTMAVLAALLVVFGAMSVFGIRLMSSEKLEKYNAFVLSIANDQSGLAFEDAILIFPEKPDAYREQAIKLFVSGLYEECIEFVKGAMAKLSAYPHDAGALRLIGDIYHTQGNAFFELGLYLDSLPAFEAAIGNKPGDPEIIRNYAIAFARSGKIDEAENLLNEVSGAGIGNDSIDLLKGEIAYAKGDDRLAIQLFETVISVTDSPEIRNRAYMICIMAYRRVPELALSEITFLRNALIELPDNYRLIVQERLADALARTGEFEEAVALYEELRRSGNLIYGTWQNIGVLYQQMGDFDGAREVYMEMAAAYPEDYRPPMRLAFLSLEEQAALSIDGRDYGETAQWHALARGLYDKRPQSASDDMEMLLLNSQIEELRQNGWIQ